VKRFLLAVLILLIALQLVVAALLGTEPGSRWLIYRLLPLVPGSLQISQINGTVLKGITINDLVYQNNDLSVRLESAELAIDTSQLWQGWLHAKHFHVDGLQINLPAPAADPSGEFVLPGSLSLPFGVVIASGRLGNLQISRGQQSLLHLDLIELDNASMRSQLDIGKLAVQQQPHQASFDKVNIKLAMPYQIKATMHWQSELPALTSWFGSEQLGGNARLSGSLINLIVRHQLSAPQPLDSQIQIAPFSRPLNFTSQHQWQRLILSLPNARTIELSSGNLKLDADQDVVSLAAEGHIALDDIIDGQLRIDALGNWQQAKTLSISIAGNNNELDIRGAARWLPEISFNLITDGRGIDPAMLDPRLTGSINVSGNMAGQRRDNKWQILADSVHLSGLLRDQPVEATLHAALTHSVLSLNGEAHYGGNQIGVDGRIGENIDLRGQLQLPHPQSLHPQLRGSADINWHIYGSRSEPLVDIDAHSQQFGFTQYTVKNISLKGRQLGPASEKMELSASSDDVLYYSTSLLNGTSLQLDGGHSDHRLSWSLHQDAARLSGSARGAVSNNADSWNGVLDQLTLTLTDFPDWLLIKPAALSLSAQQKSLEKLCLSNGDGHACASANTDSEQLSANLTINALPMAPFSALLGPDILLTGELQHSSDLRRDKDGNWHGTLHSSLTEAGITFNDGPQDYSLGLEQVELSAMLAKQKIEAMVSVIMTGHGHLRASASTGIKPGTPLQGQLDVAITELRWLELLTPAIRQRSGSLTGQLMLSGQRSAPQFHGELSLQNGEIDIADAGLTLRDMRAKLRADGKLIYITASTQSGPGAIDVKGHLDLAKGLPGELDLQIAGERFQIIDLPEAKVLVNPSVTLKGNMELLRLRGDIEIPHARLAPQQLPEIAVRVSEDQIIINSLQPPATPLKVDTELMLLIGKDVRFSGFGLDARLGGNLQFIQKPEQPTNLVGNLRIEDGRYRAYGQNLAIDQGVLIFQEKIDNPGLNIRAVRRIPSAQVVAGVELSGTLQKPEARLISEPAMEESEIMAWLLTGRGLTSGSESDNAMIAQALAVYGLEQGSGVTEKIGDRLGLDEITVGSDWEASDASLMLGKQISDRLYLRYAIGLFDAVSTVMLRYTLSRRLHLEAQSGGNRQSLDLIYQLEH
jgi:translocation and assembly module TamB